MRESFVYRGGRPPACVLGHSDWSLLSDMCQNVHYKFTMQRSTFTPAMKLDSEWLSRKSPRKFSVAENFKSKFRRRPVELKGEIGGTVTQDGLVQCYQHSCCYTIEAVRRRRRNAYELNSIQESHWKLEILDNYKAWHSPWSCTCKSLYGDTKRIALVRG